MSAGGAEDLRGTVTPFGQRLGGAPRCAGGIKIDALLIAAFQIQRSKPRHRSLGGRRGAVGDRLHLLPCSATICRDAGPKSPELMDHEGVS